MNKNALTFILLFGLICPVSQVKSIDWRTYKRPLVYTGLAGLIIGYFIYKSHQEYKNNKPTEQDGAPQEKNNNPFAWDRIKQYTARSYRYTTNLLSSLFSYVFNDEKSRKQAEAQKLEEELSQLQECCICAEEKQKREFPNLSCEHSLYCTECLTEMVDLALKEKNSTKLRCPESICMRKYEEQDVRAITDDNKDKVAQFNIITSREWMLLQPNVKHCPTPDCSFMFLSEPGSPYIMKCEQCDRAYCGNCLLDHPMSQGCEDASNEIEERNNTWKRENTKPCPKCNVLIERDNGCLYMSCRCGHSFCWNCYGTHHVGVCKLPERKPS